MPFEEGGMKVGFADGANPDEKMRQKAIDDFQVAIGAAVINLGNEGCDPAFIGHVLKQVAAGVITEGYVAVADAFKNAPRALSSRLPALHPKFSKMGGNPQGAMLEQLKGIIGDLKGRVLADRKSGRILEGDPGEDCNDPLCPIHGENGLLAAQGRIEKVAMSGTADAKRLVEEFLTGGSRTPKPDEVN